MRIVILFILVIVFVIVGYWLHEKHLNTQEPATRMITTHTTNTQTPVTTILANQQEQIKAFLKGDNPSGIMIFIKDGNHYIRYCNQKDQRHTIVYVDKKNPAIRELMRWSITPSMISAPYTIIFSHGNVILTSHGIVCDY